MFQTSCIWQDKGKRRYYKLSDSRNVAIMSPEALFWTDMDIINCTHYYSLLYMARYSRVTFVFFTQDSPINKLLYARDIPRYKQMVER